VIYKSKKYLIKLLLPKKVTKYYHVKAYQKKFLWKYYSQIISILKKSPLKLFLGIPYTLDSFQIDPNVHMEYGCT
jgi:hypothetical protein